MEGGEKTNKGIKAQITKSAVILLPHNPTPRAWETLQKGWGCCESRKIRVSAAGCWCLLCMEGKLHPDLKNDADWGAGEGLQDPIPYEEPQVIMAAEKETPSSPGKSPTGYLTPRGRPEHTHASNSKQTL